MTTKTELLNNGAIVATKLAAPFFAWDWVPSGTGAAVLTYKRYEDDVLVYTSGVINGTVEAAVSSGFIVQDFPNVEVAISVRKVSSVYAGACMKVVRVVDSVEQDIGFDENGLLDTQAILDFRAAGGDTGDIVVKTWFDQSGNGRNWEAGSHATPTAAMPRIFAPAINYVNGIPAVRSNASANIMITSIPGFASASDFSVIADDGTAPVVLSTGSATLYYGAYDVGTAILSDGTTGGSFEVDGSAVTNKGELNTAVTSLVSHKFAATGMNMAGWTSWNSRYTADSQFMARFTQERILFSNDGLTNKAAIIANQTAFFG